jgi:hypothetical protein
MATAPLVLRATDGTRTRRKPAARRADALLLVSWAAILAVISMPASVPVSWGYFDEAAALLFDGRRLHGLHVGLRLFELRPGDQFGPLSIVAAQALRVLGGTHVVLLAHVVLVIVGLGVLWLVVDAADRAAVTGVAVSRRGLLIAGGAFLFEWNHLALDSLHIDDAIALACAAIAVNLIVRRSEWWWSALAIGAATAAKPWAIMFLPLLCALPPGRRIRAWVLAAVVGIGVWAPFVIADPKTLHAARYTIVNAQGSVLRLVGVRSARTPKWDRLSQLVTALGVGGRAFVRDRWEGIVLATVAVRLMLDPGVNAYYTTGLVFGALLWDLLRPRWPWPITTLLAALLLDLPSIVAMTPTESAALRLLACVGAIAAVLGSGRRTAARLEETRATTHLVTGHEPVRSAAPVG